MLVISAFRRLKQKDGQPEASLVYVVKPSLEKVEGGGRRRERGGKRGWKGKKRKGREKKEEGRGKKFLAWV